MREKIALRVFSAVLTAGLLLAATAPAMAAGTAAGFRDVPAGSAYAEAVTYVSGRGLMKGTSATAFSPSGTLTRAMFVTILARFAKAEVDKNLRVILAEAMCRNLTRSDIHKMVDEIYDEYGGS